MCSHAATRAAAAAWPLASAVRLAVRDAGAPEVGVLSDGAHPAKGMATEGVACRGVGKSCIPSQPSLLSPSCLAQPRSKEAGLHGKQLIIDECQDTREHECNSPAQSQLGCT